MGKNTTTAKPTGWKFPMVSANLTTVKVVEQCEVTESDVEVKVCCAGCSVVVEAWGDSEREARKRLRERVAGWGVVFDREVNDGEYPYCPKCIKSIFPNLQARLKAEYEGKPLPPRDIPVSPEIVEDARAKEALNAEHRER